MKNYILLFAFALVFFKVADVEGQTTYYYAMTKKMHNGILSTKVSGGQFITFLCDLCYESNQKGVGVGHGILKLSKNYSNNYFKVYVGNSYWDDSTKFKFKLDLSVLNIITQSGDIYVYKKQTAPKSITTCSLIRKESYRRDNEANTFNLEVIKPITHENYKENSVSKSENNNTTSNRVSIRHLCPRCNGHKKIIHESNVPLYGQTDYQIKCNECGQYFMRSIGHTHIICPQCDGKGYFITK